MVGPKRSKEEGSKRSMTPVRAHPFATLIHTFLMNCKQNVMMMRDALDRVDFETVKNLAHRMSGTAAMHGVRFISETGGAIEQAAESSNLHASRDLVGKLSNYLDGVDTNYGPSDIRE